MYKYNNQVVRNIVLFLLIIINNNTTFAQNPTFASEPTPENVLVVFNRSGTTSENIKDHYVSVRNIPDINVVRGIDGFSGIFIPDSQNYPTGTVIIDQAGELILNNEPCNNSIIAVCDNIAWQFYQEHIETPIKIYLNTTININGDTLKNVIRYIVLCKGIPLKIRSAHIFVLNGYAHKTRLNVSVDALLCLVNNDDDILTLYNNPPTPLEPPLPGGIFDEDPVGGNPFYDSDPNLTMDYRFISDYFETTKGWKLNYLVSRLDGLDLDNVIDMIDRSSTADTTGNGVWVIDNTSPLGNMRTANENLMDLGFITSYDASVFRLVDNPSPVIGYASRGVHSGFSPYYIHNDLRFDYLNGAVFNTLESFNGWAMDTVYRHGHGLASDFVTKRSFDNEAGTVALGHTWEPFSNTVSEYQIFFPAYSVGYNIVDAAYMGMRYLAWQNVVIGDPLTKINTYPIDTLSGNLGTVNVQGRIVVPEGETLVILSGSVVNFERNTSLRLFGTLIISDNVVLNFNHKSTWESFENSNIIVEPGATINLNDNSLFSCYGSFNSNGTNSNNININIRNNSKKMSFINSDTINVSFASIKKGKFAISKDLSSQIFTDISFQDCVFDSCISPIDIFDPQDLSKVKFINNQLTNTEELGIRINGSQEVDISNVNIESIDINLTRSGIDINEVDSLDVYNAIINDFNDGILIDNSNSITIKSSTVNDCNNGIVLNNISSVSSGLKGNTITNSTNQGIAVTNVDEITIQNNNITNSGLGVYLSNVVVAHIIDNTITSSLNSMPGIFIESTDGDVRGNTLSGHSNGIHLGNSSPDIGDNYITDNLYHGIYIGIGSLPNMIGKLVGNPPLQYPISGYNTIFENGGWDEPSPPPDNDGSEIFINNANVLIERGCNSIMDDRAPGGNLINTKYLMSGIGFGAVIQVNAEYNFWSDNPLYPLLDRFNGLIVDFDPYYSEPCSFLQGASGGGSELLITTSSGIIIDTVYSVEGEIGELSPTELLYATATEKYLTGEYEDAEADYNQIINGSDILFTKLEAYQMLYNLGRLTDKGAEYFADLHDDYSSLSQSSSDSLLIKIFGQLATLSLIGQAEYITAIEEFDAVVQQQQGTEEALYAEIDALTTSLLLQPDSSLGKGSLGKYMVNDISDYTSRISDLLRQGKGSGSVRQGTLPQEYALYQNYPNPFNPSTTIKYSIVKSGNVKLAVYDILGREVLVLVDGVKEPGFYEVNFNASIVSSGVYFYRLVTENYVSSKKMLLLK